MREIRRLNRNYVCLIFVICIILVVIIYSYIFIWCPTDEDTTIFLVRHAEYDLSTGHLTPEGQARADELVEVLSDVDLKAIYVSQIIRTQETAQPIATAMSLQWVIESDLELLVAKIKQDHAGEEVLIVGHSDTVPLIIDILVGDSVEYSIVPNEFYHLFTVTISESGEWWAVDAHYGEIT